jgi:PAS domain S-box-containing protein
MRQPLRILLLEDDPRDAELLRESLEAEGIACEFTRVDTQPAFLAALEKNDADLILADQSLPSFDGLSALKLAKSVRPDLPVIIVSGALGEEVAIDAFKLGATDYVLKTRRSRLAPSVRRALREADERAERKRAEEALRRSEAYLAEAQTLSHTGSFGWNVSSGEIYWSEETYKIFGLDRSVKPTMEFVLQQMHPDDRDGVQRALDQAIRENTAFSVEHRLLMPDGEVKYVLALSRPSRPSPGILEYLGAVTDITDRKRAEEALRCSEAYLAEGQKLSLTGTWACNIASRRMIHSSKQHRHLFGLAPDEVEIPSLEEFFQRIHPDDRDQAAEELGNAINAGRDVEAHFRIVLPEGTTRYMYGVGRPLVKSTGGADEYVGAVTDVSSARQAEMKLRESEAYLAEAQRLSHTGSWAWNPLTGKNRYWSDECFRLLGFDPADGMPPREQFFQHIHPDDRPIVAEKLDTAVRERGEYEVDYRVVHSGGEIRYIHSIGHPILSPTGDLVEIVGTAIDVTERKQAEDNIRQSEAYLAEAARLSRTGSWAWSPATGENRYWSDECFRLLGFDPADGMPPFETFIQRIHPEDQPIVAKELERATRERDDYEVDYRIFHPGGEIRNIHVVGRPVLGPSGDLIEIVGTGIDVTERKQAEEERERLRQAQADLAHANRVSMMGELTASVAHEVNQPIAASLTNARTCLRWLAGDTPNIEEAREAAMRIVQDQTRAAEIISRIRLVFKKTPAPRELVDINKIIREMTVHLRRETARHLIAVRGELAADLPQVMGDPVQLQQVMMNLIMNAIDALADVDGARELVIHSLSEDGKVRVSVSDTGVGLPADRANHIFDAFFTTKPEGTGMGLRISRSIIEAHGGRLWADQNIPRGASFYFTLPTIHAQP